MQSKDASREGNLLPKPAEMEEFWRSWSQGFLSLGFSRGEGFSNERPGGRRRIWVQKSRGCQSKLEMGNVRNFCGGDPREERESLEKPLQRSRQE